jgi:hypothetical protein
VDRSLFDTGELSCFNRRKKPFMVVVVAASYLLAKALIFR